MLVYLSSFLFRRTPDSLNSLGGAVFLLMLINPLSAADIGLTLSVLATFGIVTLHVRLAQWYDKRLNTITFTPARRLFKGVVDVLSISLCATAFTLPVILVEFNVINILAPISNLLVAGIASPAMVIGGLAAVFGATGLPLLEQPLFTCAGALLRVMIRLSNAFADIPYAAYYVRDGSAVRLLLTVFVVTAVFWILMRRELLRPMAAYLTALAIVVGACVAVPAMRDRDCAVLQIVQGSNPCVLIRNAGQTVLIGSGREGIGLNLLELNNIYRLDFVFFWSDDSDPDESRILRRCRGVEPVFQGEMFHADFSDGMALSSDGETLLLQVTGRTVRIAENLTGDGADVLIAGGLSEEIDYAHVLAVETNSSYAKGRNALTVPYNSAIIITIDKDAQLALDGGP